jgi:nifR3 family TIM-barrel protein
LTLENRMHIASVEIPGRIFLAPLAAYTSWPFRRICRRFGAALATTEVVKASALLLGIPATLQVLEFKPDEHPIAGQLLAADPAEAGEGAARLGEMGFDLVDLNCGCPKRRVLSDGMGGALMASPEQVERIVAQMVRRAKTPVTVKMRAGRFKGRPTAVEMARRCEGAGAAALCVHPRPAEGAAAAPPDWRVIAEVKRAVSIPVIGNGGIHTPADVARMFRETACDAVAVGQAAIGKPWIFRQAAALLEDGRETPPPSQAEIRAALLEHYRGLVAHQGERRGTIAMRKQSCRYAKHLAGGKAFNLAVIQASSEKEFMDAVAACLTAAARSARRT